MPAPGLLANDADLDLDPLQAVPLSGPASGSLALAPSGAFVYTPTLNFNGLITFTYRVTDGLAFSNQAAVTVTVSPANDPPLAADAYTTPAGLLANDADLDLDPLQAVPLSGPASGSLALAPSGAFVYTPTLNFNGLITFTYQVTDGLAFSNQAAVTVTVSPANDPPAADDLYTTPEDAVLTVPAPGLLANDADLDLDPLQAVPLSGPASGSLALAPSGAFVYTPTLNFNGLITFTYRVTDGLAFSNQAAVTVTVSPANDPPLPPTTCTPPPRTRS